MEIWRDIRGFKGIYEVSDLGQVRRVRPARGTSAGKLRKIVIDNRGYSTIYFHCKLRKFKKKGVHTMVLEAFDMPRPKGLECRHLDGDKQNCRRSNLCWGTHSENERDKIRHGTNRRGRQS